MRTYEPAWSYQRHGWPTTTGIRWVPGDHGDELRLWLPPGMMGIRVHDEAALEALAWQEKRVRTRLRTWMTRPGKAPYGVMVYVCPSASQFQQNITTGVTVESGNIPVWPTPTDDGDRWTWYDPGGTPLLGSPPEREMLHLPGDWAVELTLSTDASPDQQWTTDQSLRQFVDQTFLPNGREHLVLSEEVHAVYADWCRTTSVPAHMQVGKVALARWLSESTSFHRWSGRTRAGYRRGFTGLRYPDGSWNS